uniref:AN1-type zinc finger protein 2B n=1 Tax=Schistosoma haematobium TaxID=6185 RepID=A0A095A435_SCHHA
MEFPNLGANCSVPTCRMLGTCEFPSYTILDFLPVRCSGCHGVFCKNHYLYDSHNCKSPDLKDKQVPVCPLCGTIVPLKPGELPDVKVGNHIDTDCRSKPALELKGKLFTNACCVPRCKKKELIPFVCDRCKLNFCVSHRNELDHDCKGFQQNLNNSRKLSTSGAAALYRAIFSNFNTNSTSKNVSPTNTIHSSSPVATSLPYSVNSRELQEEEDLQLALALSESLSSRTSHSQPSRTTRHNTPSKSSCNIS